MYVVTSFLYHFKLSYTLAAKSYGMISIWQPLAILIYLQISQYFGKFKTIKRVKINHKNTFKMFKNIAIVLCNLRDLSHVT